MGVLRADHPDILEFIRTKRDGTSLHNFNLSVSVTDDFLRAARAGLRVPLVNPRTGACSASIRAREVFDAIVEATWSVGDPGLLFHDAINRANPTPSLGRIEATNPCGEVPLLPYEACNLGSIDVAKLVIAQNGTPRIDWPELGLKGITFFRFGSRSCQVIQLGAGENPGRYDQGSTCDPAECAI